MGTLPLTAVILNVAFCFAAISKALRDEVSLPRYFALVSLGMLCAFIAAAIVSAELSPV
jgi:hypothetical protein